MLPGLLSIDQIGHNGNNILDRNTNLQSSSSSLSNSYLLHRISLTDSHSLKQRTVLLNRIKIDSDGEGNTNLIGTSISIHSLFIHSSYLLPIVTEVVSILVEKPSFFKDLEICSAWATSAWEEERGKIEHLTGATYNLHPSPSTYNRLEGHDRSLLITYIITSIPILHTRTDIEAVLKNSVEQTTHTERRLNHRRNKLLLMDLLHRLLEGHHLLRNGLVHRSPSPITYIAVAILKRTNRVALIVLKTAHNLVHKLQIVRWNLGQIFLHCTLLLLKVDTQHPTPSFGLSSHTCC